MISGSIYVITNTINDKVYIGQTSKQIEQRYNEHCRDSFNEKSSDYDSKFHRAIRKHHKENFKIKQLQCFVGTSKALLKSKLDEAEIEYIEMFDSMKNGYNSTLGGDGNLGHKWSEESRKKMMGNKNALGYKQTEEHKNMKSKSLLKPILQLSKSGGFIKEWESANSAAKELEISRGNISSAALGKLKTAGGFIWKFK